MNTCWSLAIKCMSWVEHTEEEVDFILKALNLKGGERVLDLACGFGRHSLELARRGFNVTGIDFTEVYIEEAKATAKQEGLSADFLCCDIRATPFCDKFDVVLNMADGAIGYLESDEENLKIFDVVSRSLKKGGRHLMGICSAAHAKRHFPKRHWEAGRQALSLADFKWNASTRRMIYQGHVFKFGSPLPQFPNDFKLDETDVAGTRLYTLEELAEILQGRGMRIDAAYGAYDTAVPASEDRLMQVVCSTKI